MCFARNDQNRSGAFHESQRTCDCVCGFDADFAIRKKIKTSYFSDKRTPERFSKEFNDKIYEEYA